MTIDFIGHKDIAIVSGYFNPLHTGHLDYLEGAKELADMLIVIVNNDKQQMFKKGKIIINEQDRARIVSSLSVVSEVYIAEDEDGSVCNTLRTLGDYYRNRSIVFCNGGDRYRENIPEVEICEKMNIEIVFGVGGTKTVSSTEINKQTGKE